MSLFSIFFSIQSIIFLFGIDYIAKKITLFLSLNKNLKIIIFSVLLLIISFIFYFLYSLNLKNLEFFSLVIFYFFFLVGILKLVFKSYHYNSNKIKKKLNTLNIYDLIFFIILINVFLSCLVPVTDGDSVRYHLGQFNYYQKFSEFDLHSKISYIGDGLNIISYYSSSLNIISCLNFYYLFSLLKIINKSFSFEKKYFFTIFVLSIPIYLNLLISQKPFIWLIFNLFLIFYFTQNKTIKLNLISFALIFINLSLIQITKPEFLAIIPIFIIFLLIMIINNFNFFEKHKPKNIFIILISISFFPLIFFIYNFFEFSDPTKILFTQNNIAEKNFVNFLKNSNLSFSFSNILEFFFNLGIPLNYFDNFPVSLGIGFFICVIFSKFNFSKEYILVICLILINLLFYRFGIDHNHSRNYILIYLIIIYLFLQNKISYKKQIKFVLLLQLIITQIAFVYFNSEIYMKKNYNNISYNYINEDLILKNFKNLEETIIITEIDGNLFKKYDFINIDYFNFEKKFFFEEIINTLEFSDYRNIYLIFKNDNFFNSISKYKINEIELVNNTRNPFKRSKRKFNIYKIPKKNLANLNF
tara:strand:+ start:1434 stop:3188 length:1755 start_codon:yes stop_codon:yes gene_type:complete